MSVSGRFFLRLVSGIISIVYWNENQTGKSKVLVNLTIAD